MKNLKYFQASIVFTLISLILGAGVGYYYNSTMAGAMAALFNCVILGILEVSISFDNAVVNASVLRKMTPLWQHRFITWGMWIAVFGMRLVFPLLVVGVAAHLNPWEALVLAAMKPAEYAQVMLSVHHEVSSFGGTFLMLVALKYFLDHEKDNHWIQMIEAPLAKMGRLEAVQVGLVILFLIVFSRQLHGPEQIEFLYAGLAGVLTFLAVEAVGTFLQIPEDGQMDIHKASLGMFLYLEVLDASFSFDGVVGAFAITNNLFIIAIGLGIGAMFVRSLTIMMVEKGTLDAFLFLEHGAFYAVGALAALMYLDVIMDVPEVLTGLIGAVIIGTSIFASHRQGRLKKS